MWRHSHNVCCGDIATMFDVETQCLLQVQPILLFFFLCCHYSTWLVILVEKRYYLFWSFCCQFFCWNSRYQYFVLLFLFYLYICNYLHFCCCILYSDHSFTLKLLIFFYKKKSIRERNFFFIDPIKYWYFFLHVWCNNRLHWLLFYFKSDFL